MNLDDLNKLQKEADNLEYLRKKNESALASLVNAREDGRGFSDVNFPHGLLAAEAKIALRDVVNEQVNDLLHLAELRLTAKARELRLTAAQKMAIIRSSIIGVGEP